MCWIFILNQIKIEIDNQHKAKETIKKKAEGLTQNKATNVWLSWEPVEGKQNHDRDKGRRSDSFGGTYLQNG